MIISHSVGNRGFSEPFFLQVARGHVPGHRAVLRAGINFDIDAGVTASIWDRGGLYAFPAAAALVTVSSNNAADTAAGTGARTVRIDGLDANYLEISEVLSLAGTSGVPSAQQFLRVFGVTVLTAGSGATAAGSIFVGTGAVTGGVPANVYAMAQVGYNVSQMLPYTVPAGFTAYLADVSISTVAGGTLTAGANSLMTIRARANGGVFLRSGSLVITGGAVYLGAAVPRSFPEKTDIDGIATATEANTIVTGQLRYLLVSNNLNEHQS